ncbi:MAG: HupE/UreJ family protein [Leucothrix sp.]
MKIQVRYPLLAALICFAWPLSAWAIGSPSTNFFIKGLYHPMMVPAHLIALFALGLLIGQQGWATLRTAFPVFFVTLTAALLMTRYQSAAWNAELVLLPLAALTGVLVVLKLNLPKAIPLIIAIIAAIVIGMDSSVPRIPGLQATKIYAHLSGSGVFASLLLLMISLLALALHKLLAGIVLRVLGAWSTAGAVLVVTLLLVADANP